MCQRAVCTRFENYLSDGKQNVCISGANYYSLRIVTCGVPHGSVLGPHLYLIYINDICNSVPGVCVKLFAYDTNLLIYLYLVMILLIYKSMPVKN